MKKIIARVLLTTFLMAFIIPTSVSAFGGYYVIKGEKVFHSVLCTEVMGYCLEDLKYYETEAEAKKAGLTSADCCVEDVFDYESDGDTVWYSDDRKWQNALEMERLFGVFDGYDAGRDEGYDIGYEEGSIAGKEIGYEEGHQVGFEEGYQEGFDEGEDSKKRSNSSELLLLIIPCVMAFFIGKHCKQADLESDLKKCRIENAKLSASLKDQQDATYVLNLIVQKAHTTSTALAESLFINFRKAAGCSEEEARAELQREKQNWPQNK